MISARPFGYTAQWRSIVATLDTALLLHHHTPGALAGLGKYLHDRTGGMIGSLSHLIRAAALQAIMTGTEKITRKILESITLDHAAEQQTARNNPRPGYHAAGRSHDRPRPAAAAAGSSPATTR